MLAVSCGAFALGRARPLLDAQHGILQSNPSRIRNGNYYLRELGKRSVLHAGDVITSFILLKVEMTFWTFFPSRGVDSIVLQMLIGCLSRTLSELQGKINWKTTTFLVPWQRAKRAK